MSKTHPKLYRFLWICCVLAVITLDFTIAFFITGYIYGLVHWRPPALLAQIVNSFLGLVITGWMIHLLGHVFRFRQMDTIAPVIAALERIANGDFSIHLEEEQENGILGNLVASVNKMALNLGQMENMRQEFISNVSHEIQSPLTSIRGFAQALRDHRLSPQERQHYLEIIEMESSRLSRLSDELLKLASLDSEQARFAPRSYRLDKQIRSMLLTCEPQWRDKALEVDATLDEVSLTADEDLLSQVWMNLLHNSIKFTPRGGSIKVTLHARLGRVECAISDTGCGISAEDRVHIFERFYKADKSRTSAQGGSGLGLAIVKKIVDMHQGRIDFESELGKGTTFIVSLPQENV